MEELLKEYEKLGEEILASETFTKEKFLLFGKSFLLAKKFARLGIAKNTLNTREKTLEIYFRGVSYHFDIVITYKVKFPLRFYVVDVQMSADYTRWLTKGDSLFDGLSESEKVLFVMRKHLSTLVDNKEKVLSNRGHMTQELQNLFDMMGLN